MHRHTGPSNRHSGASRNLGRVVICTVIPAPPTVIPAQAGIYVCGETSVGRANTPYNRHSGSPNRHSGASRNLCVRRNGRRARQYPLQPSFRRKPESMCAGERASDAPILPTTVIPAQARIYACGGTDVGRTNTPTTVIPAQAGIYACRLHYSSRRLQRWIPAKAGMTVNITTRPRGCGHIAIYRSPA